jgi:hypothetical protein
MAWTTKTIAAIHIGISLVKFVTALAVGLQSSMLRDAFTSMHVYLLCNRFKMVRIATDSIAAFMVEYHTFCDRAD